MASFRTALEPFLPIVRYVIAGTTAAAFNIGTLYALVSYGGMHYLAASVCSYTLALGVGFTLQKFWTFRNHATANMHGQFIGYTAVALMNLAINTGAMYFFVDILGIWYIFAQILSGGIIAVTGYVCYRFFVFKHDAKPVPTVSAQ